MLTLQEVFDKSVGGVIAQGRPGRNLHRACSYRTADGLKCAAGHLIEDEHYYPALEGNLAWGASVRPALKASGVPDSSLVSALQVAHDDSGDGRDFLPAFAKRSREIAAEYNLDPSAAQLPA